MWRGPLLKQVIFVLFSTGLFFALRGAEIGFAALYGGLIALVNVQLLVWRKRRVSRMRGMDARASLRVLYRSALERFVIVAALFALGLGLLGLDPLALLVTFLIGQSVVLFMWAEQEQHERI